MPWHSKVSSAKGFVGPRESNELGPVHLEYCTGIFLKIKAYKIGLVPVGRKESFSDTHCPWCPVISTCQKVRNILRQWKI